MISLEQYISESKLDDSIGNILGELFTGTKISKDTLISTLKNLDMKNLSNMSKYYNYTESSQFLPYCPGDDMFLNESNKNTIVELLADYIIKYCLDRKYNDNIILEPLNDEFNTRHLYPFHSTSLIRLSALAY